MIRRARRFLPGGRLMLAMVGFVSNVFAGQSLVVAANTPPINVTDPFYPQNQSWRVEFQIHNWALPAAGHPPLLYFAGLGFAAYISPNGALSLESLGDTVVQQQPCFVNISGTNALVRFQRNVAAKLVTCEAWSYDSTGYNTQTDNIATLGNLNYPGGTIGGGVAFDLAFFRVSTTLLPLGSRPPATGDTGDWTNLKFDGNLTDSSGKSHGGSGSAAYISTPNQVPVALLKTAGAPFWTNWTSLRAGFPAQLDGSNSYTLADGNAAMTFFWQQVQGPSTVIWQNRNATVATMTGLVFGTYTFRLTVTDAAGNNASATLDVGAVATDSNGVVVQANPAADAIFGPMIAFGKNPWGWADERNLKMETLEQNRYATPPSWASPAENATVSYSFFDPISAPVATTLAGAITATALTIPVTSAGSLDLSTLPTEILIGNPAVWEAIRICSVAGNNLNVCYDGRGFHYGFDSSYLLGASAWAGGTKIWQSKVKGSGTHFLTTMCAYGAGWMVAANHAVTSTGTVTVTPGATAATGNGTAWDGTQNSLAIAIFATHGGTPFTFFAYVSTANATSLTLARPFPADADAGSYSYHIFSDQRRIVLHYTRSDSTDGSIYFPTVGCESDTDLYLYSGWDNGYANQPVSASAYSFIDSLGYVNDVSPNYYDMGLAHYAFYFRSGLKQALTSARNIEDYWIRYPENAEGDGGGSPRDKSMTGVFAAAVLDGDRASNWSGLRSYAQSGLTVANQNNCDDDLRETAYELSWLALAAQFDPDPVKRAAWQAGLAGASYNRDNNCKRSDNSFAAGNYWNTSAVQIAATQGSQTATAVNGTFPSSVCTSTAHGTAAASNGSALLTALTGSFVAPAGTYKLLVGGTINGVRYDLSTQFDYNSPNSLTMAALWPGDSGTVYWSIETNDNLFWVMTIAQGPTDTANFGRITSCSLIDSTHIQLYRPWPTASGTFSYFYYNLVGRGTQPFMAGIKALQMRFAGQVYAPYRTLDQAVANWVATVGFDPATKGIYYGRGFPQCEPPVTDSGITDVQFRIVSCIEDSFDPAYVAETRARNSEAQNAMTVNYLGNPTSANQAIGDLFYGATYGAAGYTAPGYFSDGLTSSNLDDVYLAAYKWPGFFFGIGMAHQWPAARVGGVAPPQNRTVYVSLNIGSGLTAQIVVTAPSGAVTTYPCGSSSPCAVTVDDRQGSHWYKIQYLSQSGAVASQSDPDLLTGPAGQ
jgi:hypothetical protein